jgi:hypothetical protein
MDLTSLLMQSLGDNGIEQIGRQAGMNPNQTSAAMSAVVPMLLGAMAKNSSSPEGASGLLGALDKDHDGSILDDLGGFLGGAMISNRSSNGAGILKHILGGNQTTVESGLANKVGVDSASIAKLMTIVAPLIMAYLGKQKRSAATSGFDSGGLGDMLGNLAGGSSQGSGIDIGDIMDMVGGLSGSNQRGGATGGGLLGGLLKGFMKSR